MQEQANHSIEVHAKPEYHKFLIGRGGANIRQVREETGARVVFPTSRDEDKTLITIIGTKENTGKAKDKLLELIKDLVSTPSFCLFSCLVFVPLNQIMILQLVDAVPLSKNSVIFSLKYFLSGKHHRV